MRVYFLRHQSFKVDNNIFRKWLSNSNITLPSIVFPHYISLRVPLCLVPISPRCGSSGQWGAPLPSVSTPPGELGPPRHLPPGPTEPTSLLCLPSINVTGHGISIRIFFHRQPKTICQTNSEVPEPRSRT